MEFIILKGICYFRMYTMLEGKTGWVNVCCSERGFHCDDGSLVFSVEIMACEITQQFTYTF